MMLDENGLELVVRCKRRREIEILFYFYFNKIVYFSLCKICPLLWCSVVKGPKIFYLVTFLSVTSIPGVISGSKVTSERRAMTLHGIYFR